MSVKSLTVIQDDGGNDICVLSRNINGDLTSHGEELKRFLRGCVISKDGYIKDSRHSAASMGHLAVQMIKRLQINIGLIEMLPAGTRDQGEEYIYSIYPRHALLEQPSLLNLRVEAAFPHYTEIDPNNQSKMTVLYDGLLDEFDANVVRAQWEHAADELDHFVDTQVELAKSAAAN
ncbi:MAG: hypothetical protein ABJB40_13795 [Acidobacteriota bacterium]